MHEPNGFVFDSYALIGYLENEPFSDQLQHVLTQAKNREIRLFMHAIHIGEVYYITLREQGRSLADLAYSRIKALPIKTIDRIDEELLLAAASLKAKHPISYADSFAAALAMMFLGYLAGIVASLAGGISFVFRRIGRTEAADG